MKKGFTLLELLIVVTIIGVTATLFIATMKSIDKNKNQSSVDDKNINPFALNCEMYKYSKMIDVPASCLNYFYQPVK